MVYGQMGNGMVFGMLALFGAYAAFFFLIAAVFYIYYALVFMTIAKKLKYDKPWLAWIPLANMFLIPILAKKDWPFGFLLFIPIVNIVFMIMWMWAIYERRKYPGYLALIPLASIIPFLGFVAAIANMVVLGLVAWKDQ